MFKLTKNNLLLIDKIKKVITNKRKYKKEMFETLCLKEVKEKKYKIIVISIICLLASIIMNTSLLSLVFTFIIYLFIFVFSNVNKMKKYNGCVDFYSSVLNEKEFILLRKLTEYDDSLFEYLIEDDLDYYMLKNLSKRDKISAREFKLLLENEFDSSYNDITDLYIKIIKNYYIDSDLLNELFTIDKSTGKESFLKETLDNSRLHILYKIVSNDYIFLLSNFKKDSFVFENFIGYIIENMTKDKRNEIFQYIINTKFDKTSLLKVIHEEIDKLKDEDLLLKRIMNKKEIFMDYIISKVTNKIESYTIQELFTYSKILSFIDKKNILDKILMDLSLKDLVSLMLEENDIYAEDKKLIWNYLNGLDVKDTTYMKKEIINKVLKDSNEDNIKLYEIEFINLAEQLEIDKDLLFIMKEKIKKNIKIEKIKELKIINI